MMITIKPNLFLLIFRQTFFSFSIPSFNIEINARSNKNEMKSTIIFFIDNDEDSERKI